MYTKGIFSGHGVDHRRM